jgi:hypothetical protein
MSFGFEATNNNGKVLVSEQVRTLHFFAKAELLYTTDNSFCGGSRIYIYGSGAPSVPIPFFTMPTDGNSYGITRIFGSEAGWYIEVIHGVVSGLSSALGPAPELYMFCDLTNRAKPLIQTGTVLEPGHYDTYWWGETYWVPDRYNPVYANDNMGLVVYGPNGPTDVAHFDSRFSPLVVIGGANVIPPPAPFVNALPSGNDAGKGYQCNFIGGMQDYMRPVTTSTGLAVPASSKPIYSYSAMAQCERETIVTWEQSGGGEYYFNGIFDNGFRQRWTIYHSSKYWAFYRGAITKVGAAVYTTWAVAAYSCGYKSNGSGFNSWSQSSDGDASWSAGSWPYSNKTLNMRASPVIVSNGTLYD